MPHRRVKDAVAVDCKTLLGRNVLKTHLQEGRQIDLLNVDYTVDGVFSF